ncbi:MAG: DUF504 domain-containing protein [Acidobacteriota bacterium]|nr:DUF504 domain-containing protein [Acidobacteriota bacterium]
MIPIQDLLHRIRWDPVFGRGQFEIAYVNHLADQLERVPLDAVRLDSAEPFGFEARGPDGLERFIPFHRVREVYRDGELIWSRPPHPD